MKKPLLPRSRAGGLLAAALVLGLGLSGRAMLLASDHQDTPEVELAPRFDVNDVYAFPAATPGRVVLVLGTSSPITPAQTPSFTFGVKDKELYQLKIDNNGDAREDLVFQVTFTGNAGNQIVTLRGPVAPNGVGTSNTLVNQVTLSGPVNQVLGSRERIQLFAGPRDDPFFIDLEQFFRIIPDRRPVTGPLSVLRPPAATFRSPREAKDFLRGINDMAIVIELPATMLSADGKSLGKFGVWGTTSRARGT